MRNDDTVGGIQEHKPNIIESLHEISNNIRPTKLQISLHIRAI